ncbi:MAG: hypothetical protein GXN97_00710 [Aquificae bacterium]|nr:hypothetical protein [Aquificota bacterium]
MNILALHDNEAVANLLTQLSMITEINVLSAPNEQKFLEYLNKGKFDGFYILEKFFIHGIRDILKSKNAKPAVVIFLEKEENLEKFLRLGVTEANIETVPFNPLTLFTKTVGLSKTLDELKNYIEHGKKEFNFYKHGFFNLINLFSKIGFDGILSVKDLETSDVLYAVRVKHGQVVSSNKPTEEIAKLNIDDSIPKMLSLEPIAYEDVEMFQDSAEFYSRLLKAEIAKPKVAVVSQESKKQVSIELVKAVKENPLRERRVYKFQYKDYTIYSQPLAELGELEINALVVIPFINEQSLVEIKSLKLKNPNIKFLTSDLIKYRLKTLGLRLNFETPEKVQIEDLPFVGNKFESAFFFPNGVLITGTMFGSYVSKDVDFFDRIFLSHLRVFHVANIGSYERIKFALQHLKSYGENSEYIIPAYGYPIDSTNISTVFVNLENWDFPQDFAPLSKHWKSLAEGLGLEAKTFDEFIQKLATLDSSILYTFIDDLDLLGITPIEV